MTTILELACAGRERMVRVAIRCGAHDRESAEDAVQEALLALVKAGAGGFRGENDAWTFIHRVVANATVTGKRKYASRRKLGLDVSWDDTLDAQPRDDGAGPQRLAESGELGKALELALSRLPESHAKAWRLSELELLPNGEIASQLGASLPAVKSWLHRARAALRSELAGWAV
jgi:RNA polymerase sigma-70 factor, ECF subfamily